MSDRDASHAVEGTVEEKKHGEKMAASPSVTTTTRKDEGGEGGGPKKSSMGPFTHLSGRRKPTKRILNAERRMVDDFVFSADSTQLFCTNDGGRQIGSWALERNVRFSPAQGSEGEFNGRYNFIEHLCASPDGRFVVGGGAYGLMVWNARTLVIEHELMDYETESISETHVWTLKFNDSSAKLASGGFLGTVSLYHAGGDWPLLYRVKAFSNGVKSLCFVSPLRLFITTHESDIKCIDVTSGGLTTAIENAGAVFIAYSDVFGVISACKDGTLVHWGQGATKLHSRQYGDQTWLITVSGNLIAGVSDESFLRIWSLPALEEVAIVPLQHSARQICFDTTGSWLVCDQKNELFVWGAYPVGWGQ